jgi:cytochrome P450
VARRLVGELARRGRAEAVIDLAVPMVATTIALRLGRMEDAAELTSWGITSWEHLPDGSRSGARLDAYVDRRLDAAVRRVVAASGPAGGGDQGAGRAGGGDAFARIAAASIEGRPLTRLEQVGLANLILAGGRDTVIHILCGALWHLAGDATARRALRADPSRLQLAIEEYLRYLSPNTGMERRATTDVAGEWGSARAGEIVILGWGPANHDPSAFEAPGDIRLDRRPNPHLAFGSGPHTCIGIHLARLEVRVFLEELLAAVPDWRLGEGVAFDVAHLAADDVPTLFHALPLVVG